MHMNSGSRYAIYFVPAADQPLFRFGRAVLGYDCYTGEELAYPAFNGLAPAEWAALTREPRVYGFHATLKAPFRRLPTFDEAALVRAFAGFAASRHAIPMIKPCVRTLGPFIAIMSRRPCAALDDLAARCVKEFDCFRAPLTRAERERRLAAGLGSPEIANLERWGYPFVFETFRFHMTLAGPVALRRRDVVLALMQKMFARQCGHSDVIVDRVALLRQYNAQARFRVVAQAQLNGET
jgi:putative phosphonate metabolism protein